MKMRRTCFAILAAPLISVAAAQAQTNRACHDADLVVRDAKIVTMDATRSVATSMAIRNGRILTVGTPKDVASCIGSYTSVLDLHGQTVLPGLIDIHTHAAEWMARRFRNNVDLSDPKLRSIEDVAKAIAAVVASSPKGKWIRGSGWSEAGLAEHRYINRKDLDAVSPDNPVWLLQFSGHLAVVNTAALELAGISRDTPNPPGGVIDKDEAGEPTGVLKDNAVDVVAALVPPPSSELLVRSVAMASEAALSFGLTTIHDITPYLAAYQAAHREGKLKVRVQLSPNVNSIADAEVLAKNGIHTGFGDNFLKLGAAKMYADGAPSAKTAAVYTPAEGEPGNLGLLIWKPEALQKAQRILAAAGWQLETHAIGDRAIDEVLDSYQAVMKELSLSAPRFRIEHCAISTPAILQRLLELHVQVASNPSFVFSFGSRFAKFGPERVRWIFPEKAYLENGIVAGAGSDVPITPLNPWLGISAAVLRRDSQTGQIIVPEERITILQALEMYTRNGAYVGFEEEQKGSLEPGKLADFVVIDRDVLSVSSEELKDVKVLKTFVGGELVYESRP
jgi:predicted amidohydrolase YtcJ